MKHKKRILFLVLVFTIIISHLQVTKTIAAEIGIKVYKVTPSSQTFNRNMMNYSTYNGYTKHYYLLRSYLEEFEKQGGGTLVITKGTYIISNTVYVPSNVTIKLEDGVRIEKGIKTGTDKFKASSSIFQLIRPSYSTKKGAYGMYDGEKNIKFIGQGDVIIDLNYITDNIAIISGHNKNISIENIRFQNMQSGHFIEMDATDTATIRNNEFINSKPSLKRNKEAINLDTPDRSTEGWSQEWSKFDKTPNKNVTIGNNQFYNLDRAVGTHKYSGNKYHNNILIINNKIEKMRQDPIRVLNWSNSRIEGNVIVNVDNGYGSYRGILASGAINLCCKNNSFEKVARPIQFMPWKNSASGEQYDITYNNLSNDNIKDLLLNKVKSVSEAFIRINHKYNIYDNYTDKIYLYKLALPTLGVVTDVDNVIRGTAKVNLSVYADIQDNRYKGIINSNGQYEIKIPKQQSGTIIKVFVKDSVGNTSSFRTIKVVVKTATNS
jgi:hypothetical protein